MSEFYVIKSYDLYMDDYEDFGPLQFAKTYSNIEDAWQMCEYLYDHKAIQSVVKKMNRNTFPDRYVKLKRLGLVE